MKIGLMGFELKSPNKGCEALAYAFIDFLYSVRKDSELTVYLLDVDSSGDFPELYPKAQFVVVPVKLKDIKLRWIRTVAGCDVIFDITMGDGFSDIYDKDYCRYLIKIKSIIERVNKKYVLMPQTYGPFYDETIKRRALSIVKKAYKVYSRDIKSIEYLQENGADREIKEYCDLAFMLDYDSTKYPQNGNKKKLGLNVSGLLWRGGFNGNNQFGLKINYREYTKRLIQKFSESNEWEVHLIPHVIDLRNNAHDDDCFVITELHKEFPNTIVAPFFLNPIDAKSYISNMDCFIGARMHATIAAFSSGVPVIPVSYSRKFEGVYERLDYPYVIDGKINDTKIAYDKTIEYVLKYKSLKKLVQMENCKIKEKIGSLYNELQNIIFSFQHL